MAALRLVTLGIASLGSHLTCIVLPVLCCESAMTAEGELQFALITLDCKRKL